jgi:enhancing lycopene biosynthesis protein 2
LNSKFDALKVPRNYATAPNQLALTDLAIRIGRECFAARDFLALAHVIMQKLAGSNGGDTLSGSVPFVCTLEGRWLGG